MNKTSKSENCKKILSGFLMCEPESLISLNLPDSLTEKLLEYRKAYAVFCKEYSERAVSDTVLRAYYSKDKLQYFLKGLSDFAENISDEDAPIITAKTVYGNYIYFIRELMNELNQNYEHARKSSKNELAAPYDTADIHIAAEAEKLLRRIEIFLKNHGKAVPDRNSTAYKEYREIMSEYRKWKGFFVSKKNIGRTESEIDSAAASCKKRTEALKVRRKEAEELYAKLCALLTDRWFDGFDPSIGENGLADTDTERLKEYYSGKLGVIRREFLKKENFK